MARHVKDSPTYTVVFMTSGHEDAPLGVCRSHEEAVRVAEELNREDPSRHHYADPAWQMYVWEPEGVKG